MGSSYVCQRNDLVQMAVSVGRRLSLKDDTIHDAVLLMDRVMSTGIRVGVRNGAISLVFASVCSYQNLQGGQLLEGLIMQVYCVDTRRYMVSLCGSLGAHFSTTG